MMSAAAEVDLQKQPLLTRLAGGAKVEAPAKTPARRSDLSNKGARTPCGLTFGCGLIGPRQCAGRQGPLDARRQ